MKQQIHSMALEVIESLLTHSLQKWNDLQAVEPNSLKIFVFSELQNGHCTFDGTLIILKRLFGSIGKLYVLGGAIPDTRSFSRV